MLVPNLQSQRYIYHVHRDYVQLMYSTVRSDVLKIRRYHFLMILNMKCAIQEVHVNRGGLLMLYSLMDQQIHLDRVLMVKHADVYHEVNVVSKRWLYFK